MTPASQLSHAMLLQDLREATETLHDAINWARVKGILLTTIDCQQCNLPMRIHPTNVPPDFEVFCCLVCHLKKSIRTSSFAFRANLPIQKLLLLIYYWSVDSCNKDTVRELELTNKTVTSWYKFCRTFCTSRLENGLIGGIGATVEIDESLITKRKYHRGRLVPERWVFGGIERTTGTNQKRFIEFVDNRSKVTLLEIIQRRIAPGTIIMSDGWGAYRNLSRIGYRHFVVNHSKNFVHPENRNVHTQNVENQWRQIKRWLRSKGTNLGGAIQEYLDEWQYRRQVSDVFRDVILHMASLLK